MSEIIDTKTCDTSADQVLRFGLRALNAGWVFVLALGALPVALVWLGLSVAFMVWNGKRRRRRYSDNARRLREMDWDYYQTHVAPRRRESDHRFPPEWGR